MPHGHIHVVMKQIPLQKFSVKMTKPKLDFVEIDEAIFVIMRLRRPYTMSFCRAYIQKEKVKKTWREECREVA